MNTPPFELGKLSNVAFSGWSGQREGASFLLAVSTVSFKMFHWFRETNCFFATNPFFFMQHTYGFRLPAQPTSSLLHVATARKYLNRKIGSALDPAIYTAYNITPRELCCCCVVLRLCCASFLPTLVPSEGKPYHTSS